MQKERLSIGDVVGYRDLRAWNNTFKAHVLDIRPGRKGIILGVNFRLGTLPASVENPDEWVPIECSGNDIKGFWDEFQAEIDRDARIHQIQTDRLNDLSLRSQLMHDRLKSLGIDVKPPMLGCFSFSVEQLETLVETLTSSKGG